MPYVLIVDDHDKVRELMRRFLNSSGYQVIEAESAEMAIEQIRADPPAVAFCDVHMPGASGLWLADQIRTLSPATALVLATGDTQIPPIETLRPGIIAYLVKPLTGTAVVSAAAAGMAWSAEALERTAGRRIAGSLGPGTSDG